MLITKGLIMMIVGVLGFVVSIVWLIISIKKYKNDKNQGFGREMTEEGNTELFGGQLQTEGLSDADVNNNTDLLVTENSDENTELLISNSKEQK